MQAAFKVSLTSLSFDTLHFIVDIVCTSECECYRPIAVDPRMCLVFLVFQPKCHKMMLQNSSILKPGMAWCYHCDKEKILLVSSFLRRLEQTQGFSFFFLHGLERTTILPLLSDQYNLVDTCCNGKGVKMCKIDITCGYVDEEY